MIERRSGSILVTGSLASERGMPKNVAYVASKHGVLGLARAIAVEMAPHNVRVNCVLPGFIETPRQLDAHPAEQKGEIEQRVPLGRMGTARSWPSSPVSCSATRRATSPGRTGRSTAASSAHSYHGRA